MRLLLDTHVVLWWRANDPKLGKEARRAIERADLALVSAASAWEVAIKMALGRLRIPDDFEGGVESSGFGKLPVTFTHAAAAGRLPAHHADPFDRMLVAQARTEKLTLVTRDRRLAQYEVDLLVA